VPQYTGRLDKNISDFVLRPHFSLRPNLQAFGLIFKISPEFDVIFEIRPNVQSKTERNLNTSV